MLSVYVMTEKQIELIRQSWHLVRPASKEAGLAFYEKLFAAAPGIRHLFKKDVSGQADKLMTMLSFVVSNLDQLEDIISDISALGARHNEYGAKPEHYEVVGNCIVETLQDGLAEKWNPELQQAWIAAFTIIKTAMVAAQKTAACTNEIIKDAAARPGN
jgi:hemoglobin-like flavoprotein